MELVINDRIRNRRFAFFDKFSLSLKYDAIGSAFSFEFYFNPDNAEQKEVLCIGHYHLCTVTHNGETLLTGQILNQAFRSQSTRQMVTLGGYSLPGVLEDCEIPTSLYPLQSDGLSLKQIASKLIKPFGLSMVVDSSVEAAMNGTFDTSTAKESQNIKSYLADLAAQKNIVLSHTDRGELLFTRAKTNQTPVLDFNVPRGGIPGTSFDLSFNGQAMHSHITVQKQADSDGGNAGEHTIRNPYVISSVFRPKVMTQSSGTDNDTGEAAKTALAAELKNLTLKISIDRWVIDGAIIKPNSIITVTNPEVYLYKKTRWFVESIDYKGDAKEMTATLNCVLPCVYDGTTPEYIFSGINLH